MFPGYEIDISDRVGDSDKPDAVWHRDRAKNMIRNHPEIKDLFGNTPSTAFWCITFASAQIALALGLSSQPWWVILLVAWAIGSWIDVNLFQLAHECNHNLSNSTFIFCKCKCYFSTAIYRRKFILSKEEGVIIAHN